MKRILAMLVSMSLMSGIGIAVTGTSPAVAAGNPCSAGAQAPEALANARIHSHGSGSCTNVISMVVKVCIWNSFHGSTTTLSCGNPKNNDTGNKLDVDTYWDCTAGHDYAVFTKTTVTALKAGGKTVTATERTPNSGTVNVHCHN